MAKWKHQMMMRHSFKEFDTDAICEMADVEVVAECLGMETKRIGKRTSILCPCHDDEHFNSCFLTAGGFHCFSCGAEGDVIKLVESVQKCSFRDACTFICDLYGGKEGFMKDATHKVKRILSNEELVLIGLKPRENTAVGIRKTVAVLDFRENIEPQKGQYVEFFPFPFGDTDASSRSDTTETGYYVLEERVDRDPLKTLLNTDEGAYEEMIQQKAGEAAERYRDMIKMAKDPNQFKDDPTRFLTARYCHEVAQKVGIQEWIKEMNRRIRRCDDLCIEFGRCAKEMPKAERRSIFGKIHA